ncbi:MAG: hypothetical protein ACREU7_05355, partial [Burkholderiales bacterium]
MTRAARQHGKMTPARQWARTAAVSLWLAAWCVPAVAQGLRFAFESGSWFGAAPVTVMTMRGEVQAGDATRFRQFIVNNRERFIEHGGRVVFVIDGGDVPEAVLLGELLRDALAEAWLPDSASSRCVSACFFMFVHAASRSAVADAVGMHRPYFDAQALARASPGSVRARYETLATELRTRMQQLSVPVALVERMFGLAADEVYWLSPEDLAALGSRQAWFNDYLAARCSGTNEDAAGASVAACVDELLR